MAETEVKETPEKKPRGRKKGFLPGMAPANSKALDRMGEEYYKRLRLWQAEQHALSGLKEEILARMKVEKVSIYKTPDGVTLDRTVSDKLKASKQ